MSWNSFRNGLQTVHLWAGLVLSIPFILIGVTGSIIVLIDGVSDLPIPSITRGEPQSLQRIYEAAKSAAPAGWSVAALVLPSREGEAVGAQLQLPPGRRPAGGGQNFIGSTLYIDPVSLKILDNVERRRAGPFMRSLTSLHIALMVPGFYGVRIVGFMGLAMSLFGITGLVLWWPRRGQWRQAFWLKRGVKGFRWHRDLHGATGFWSLIVFMILSISGVYLAFPVTFQSTVGSIVPVQSGLTEVHVDQATIASIPDKARSRPTMPLNWRSRELRTRASCPCSSPPIPAASTWSRWRPGPMAMMRPRSRPSSALGPRFPTSSTPAAIPSPSVC